MRRLTPLARCCASLARPDFGKKTGADGLNFMLPSHPTILANPAGSKAKSFMFRQ